MAEIELIELSELSRQCLDRRIESMAAMRKEVAAKKEAATFRNHGAPVVGAALLPSGLRTHSVDRDPGTLIWDVSKFLGGSAVPAPSDPPEKIPLIK